MSKSNGVIYQVVFSEDQRRRLLAWVEHAIKTNTKEQLGASLKKMLSVLEHSPTDGETAFHYRHMKLAVRRLCVDWLAVYYAVDSVRHLVYIQNISIVSSLGFPESDSSE